MDQTVKFLFKWWQQRSHKSAQQYEITLCKDKNIKIDKLSSINLWRSALSMKAGLTSNDDDDDEMKSYNFQNDCLQKDCLLLEGSQLFLDQILLSLKQ